jgi:hypothetical protein
VGRKVSLSQAVAQVEEEGETLEEQAQRVTGCDRPTASKLVLGALRETVRNLATNLVVDSIKVGEGLPRRSPEEVAGELGLEPSSACPVCLDLECRSCDEEARAFVRRVRHEASLSGLGRCRRCHSPLSVVYVERPGCPAEGERKLSYFGAIHACARCQGGAVAGVLAKFEEE